MRAMSIVCRWLGDITTKHSIMLNFTINEKKIFGWLSGLATLLAILVGLKQLGCNTPTLHPMGTPKTTQTRIASLHSWSDTVWVHDTVAVKVYLKAKANRYGTLLSKTDSSRSDSSFSQLVCLDSLLASGDTTAAGPDTINVCMDEATRIFYLDLKLANRDRTLPGAFTHTDSIITLRDSTTVTEKQGKSVWDTILSDAELIGSFIFGLLLGKVIP